MLNSRVLNSATLNHRTPLLILASGVSSFGIVTSGLALLLLRVSSNTTAVQISSNAVQFYKTSVSSAANVIRVSSTGTQSLNIKLLGSTLIKSVSNGTVSLLIKLQGDANVQILSNAVSTALLFTIGVSNISINSNALAALKAQASGLFRMEIISNGNIGIFYLLKKTDIKESVLYFESSAIFIKSIQIVSDVALTNIYTQAKSSIFFKAIALALIKFDTSILFQLAPSLIGKSSIIITSKNVIAHNAISNNPSTSNTIRHVNIARRLRVIKVR